MTQQLINIRPVDIRQAEVDIRTLRKSAHCTGCHEAADALQDAVDRARLLALCPDFVAQGELCPKADRVVISEAILFARRAA